MSNLQENLLLTINFVRSHIEELTVNIQSLIDSRNHQEKTFQIAGMTIHYQSETLLQTLIFYLNNVSKIIQDLTLANQQPSPIVTTYSIQSFSPSVELIDYIQLCIIEEFLSLNSFETQKVKIQTTKDTVSLLNDEVNCLFVQQQNDALVIQLAIKEEEPIIQVKTETIAQQLATETKKELTSPKKRIVKKYQQKFKPGPKILKQHVFQLVHSLSPVTHRVTAQQIVDLSQIHFLFFDIETANAMIEDIFKYRIGSHNKEPVTADEIFGYLQVHHSLDKSDKTWKPNPKQYFDKWASLLEALGININHQPFPELETQYVPELTTSYSFKPKLNISKSNVRIVDNKPKCYNAPYHPEAKIIIHNTQNIQELYVEDQKAEKGQQFENQRAFEKVVNSKIQNGDIQNNEMKTILFQTQKYYEEAYRISKDPKNYIDEPRNPIFKYFPENFSFQVQQQNQINNQQKTQQQFRLSKAFSSNFQQSPDLESNFFKEIEELEEQVDAISNHQIQMIQTVNSMKLQKSNFLQKGNMNYSSSPNMFANNYSQFPQLNENEETDKSSSKQIFQLNFKMEDVPTLKKRLARLEPVIDAYVPPSDHKFREEYLLPKNKPIFKTMIKAPSLENPYGCTQNDIRPREQLEREQREIQKQKEKEFQQKEWKKYFTPYDTQHNFVDGKRHQFLEKGEFQEPIQIMSTLLRGEAEYGKQFRLFHKQLGTYDRNVMLGQQFEH